MKDKDSIAKSNRKIKQKEAYEKMKEMGLEGILEEIAKIDSREGLSFITALLLNELMKKEREISLRNSVENKANGYYNRQLACFLETLGLSVPRDRKGEFGRAFVSSALFIITLVFSGIIGLYPNLIPSAIDPKYSLTLFNSSSSPYTLKIMTIVVIIFVPIVILYQAWTYHLCIRLLRES